MGDVRYVQGTGMQRQGTAASAGAALGEALDAYDNSLCIRERLDSHEQNDTQLKRDITYTLDRIATTEIGLDKRDDAAQSYFRSLEMRRLLSQNDPDNALYLSDVALSLEHVGDMLLRQSNAATDPPILAGVDNNELALAFYTAAEGIRAQALRKAPDDTAEQRALQAIRKKIARTSADFNDEAPVDGYGDALWSGRIGAVEARYSADAPVAGASDACWTQVRKAVDEIAKPDETAMRRPSSLNASAN